MDSSSEVETKVEIKKTPIEDLLPPANQTLFKRVQSQKHLNATDGAYIRKPATKDAGDPAATVTTAPGTASKVDLNELQGAELEGVAHPAPMCMHESCGMT